MLRGAVTATSTPTTTRAQSGTPQPSKPARLHMTNSPPTPQNSPLLNLPAELRDAIYGLVLKTDEQISVYHSGFDRPALLQTCKEIYLEALPTFYVINTFRLKTYSFDSPSSPNGTLSQPGGDLLSEHSSDGLESQLKESGRKGETVQSYCGWTAQFSLARS
ncbi:unnamed protein product [Zymoseptoria tritici ST99CH_1A5]|uniref:F-box domain-containing protein n=1 Tax=Zymoseptoria tritici ST99CH_1A5 TaxID=1276529 RepID=A0A1Y6LYT1_ZYMTR|nr:unnamed protein product [Zymoseptoria tritici ST99CH_1A5]